MCPVAHMIVLTLSTLPFPSNLSITSYWQTREVLLRWQARMEVAAEHDHQANAAKQPAVNKLKMLPEFEQVCFRCPRVGCRP